MAAKGDVEKIKIRSHCPTVVTKAFVKRFDDVYKKVTTPESVLTYRKEMYR